MDTVAPEYLQRMSSSRIFGTLFYPNALAGVLLLLTPPIIGAVLRCKLLTIAARTFVAVALSAAVLACLYWSRSKGGWLLALVQAAISMWWLPQARRIRTAAVLLLIIAGLAGFFWKYSEFFRKGATSVSARMDYWRAAGQTAMANPVFGSGPGTFAIPYQKLKRPESEMSRMVHNDYLEQASDSGLIGFLTYAAFIAAGLGRAARDLSGRAKATTSESASAPMKQDTSMNPGGQRFGVWLGLAGWALQSLFEFGLYIPALAWVAFALFGWMLGSSGKVAIASAKVMKHS